MIPTGFLIGRRGNLRSIEIGASEKGATALDILIKKVIEEPPPATGTAELVKQ